MVYMAVPKVKPGETIFSFFLLGGEGHSTRAGYLVLVILAIQYFLQLGFLVVVFRCSLRYPTDTFHPLGNNPDYFSTKKFAEYIRFILQTPSILEEPSQKLAEKSVSKAARFPSSVAFDSPSEPYSQFGERAEISDAISMC